MERGWCVQVWRMKCLRTCNIKAKRSMESDCRCSAFDDRESDGRCLSNKSRWSVPVGEQQRNNHHTSVVANFCYCHG